MSDKYLQSPKQITLTAIDDLAIAIEDTINEAKSENGERLWKNVFESFPNRKYYTYSDVYKFLFNSEIQKPHSMSEEALFFHYFKQALNHNRNSLSKRSDPLMMSIEVQIGIFIQTIFSITFYDLGFVKNVAQGFDEKQLFAESLKHVPESLKYHYLISNQNVVQDSDKKLFEYSIYFSERENEAFLQHLNVIKQILEIHSITKVK